MNSFFLYLVLQLDKINMFISSMTILCVGVLLWTLLLILISNSEFELNREKDVLDNIKKKYLKKIILINIFCFILFSFIPSSKNAVNSCGFKKS